MLYNRSRSAKHKLSNSDRKPVAHLEWVDNEADKATRSHIDKMSHSQRDSPNKCHQDHR